MAIAPSILTKIRWPDLSQTFSGFAENFAQGQAQGLREKQLRLERDKFEAARDASALRKADEERRVQDLIKSKAATQVASTLEQYKDSPELYRAAYMQALPKAVSQLEQMGVPVNDLDEYSPPSDPSQIMEWGQKQRRRVTEVSDPKRYRDFQHKIAALVAGRRQDDTLNDPQHAQMFTADWKKATEDVLFGIPEAGASRVSQHVSTGELEPAVRRKSQEKMVEAATMLGTINEIDRTAKPEYFERIGQGKEVILNELARWVSLPEEVTDDLENRQQLWNEMDQFFLIYRKWATGVAGGEAEMKRIEESILNKNLNWPQARAGLKQLRRKVSRSARLHNHLLAKGLEPGTTGDTTIAAMLGTSEQWDSEAHARKRFEQLVDSGVTDPSTIKQILKSEGYRF